MISWKFAESFAIDWIESWNEHNLDRILAHYTNDFQMSSPHIVTRMEIPEGILIGKEKVKAYWERGLELNPDLKFTLIDFFVGAGCLSIRYTNQENKMAVETFIFNNNRSVTSAIACYSK